MELKTVKISLLLSLFFSIFLFGKGFAGQGEGGTAFPKDRPIDTQMDLGFLGIIGGGMSYSIDGKPVTRDEDFRNLIYPLRDDEATRLLHESDECHFIAWMFYVAGAATGVDVALNFKPVTLLGVDWFDRISSGVVAAELFWGGGALFDSSADGRKFNAVQRYNRILEKKDEAFWGLSPQICLGQHAVFLDLGGTF